MGRHSTFAAVAVIFFLVAGYEKASDAERSVKEAAPEAVIPLTESSVKRDSNGKVTNLPEGTVCEATGKIKRIIPASQGGQTRFDAALEVVLPAFPDHVVHCSFAPSQEGSLEALKVGDTVSVRGKTCFRWGPYMAQTLVCLNGCVLRSR
jgi:hypothetical protein